MSALAGIHLLGPAEALIDICHWAPAVRHVISQVIGEGLESGRIAESEGDSAISVGSGGGPVKATYLESSAGEVPGGLIEDRFPGRGKSAVLE